MNFNEKRKLGRTDIELTQFGLGSASLGEIFALVSEEDTLSTLHTLETWCSLHRYGAFLRIWSQRAQGG